MKLGSNPFKGRGIGKGPQATGIQLDGDRELDKALARLASREFHKVVRGAVSKALTPVSRSAKKYAKQVGKNKALSKSIGRKIKAYWSTGYVVGLVGPRSNYVDPATGHRPRFTAHLVEYGTKAHVISAKKWPILVEDPDTGKRGTILGAIVKHPGTKAHPFIRRALEENRGTIMGIYHKELKARIEKMAMSKQPTKAG